ncbi:SDR family NAD(P)-dependent oxidoreductase, partial [Nocardia sp. NPDC004722]
MNASPAGTRRGFRRHSPRVAGQRILITGAARGIGAALARQLHAHGAHVALLGIEEKLLSQVAADCG